MFHSNNEICLNMYFVKILEVSLDFLSSKSNTNPTHNHVQMIFVCFTGSYALASMTCYRTGVHAPFQSMLLWTVVVCNLLKENRQWGDLSSKSLHLSSVSIHTFSSLHTLRPRTGQFNVTKEWVPAYQRIGHLCSIWKYGCGKNE